MNRSIISNEMALPERESGSAVELRPVTIGSLAVLERLGCESLPILMGLKQGNLSDHLEDMLLVLYIHLQDNEGLCDIVDKMYDDPEAIRKDAIMYGTTRSIEELSGLLGKLLYDKDMIAGSTTESIKAASKVKSKNAHTPDSSLG